MRYKMRCRFAAILKNMLIGLCLNDKWEFVEFPVIANQSTFLVWQSSE